MNKQFTTRINGILLLDKPRDLTSNGALQRVKRLFQAKKAGHTGSLDPLATGMLPICFGTATKMSQFLLESDKHYEVTAKLGVRTATGDAEGEIIATQPIDPRDFEKLDNILEQFRGPIQQIPPMYSAVKVQGKPLYELARKGIEIERQARTVQIHKLSLLDVTADTISLTVHCSKGTYIRTIVDDIGLLLGCGAHVIQLHRTAVAPYQNAAMYTLAELEQICEQEGVAALTRYLLPVESGVSDFPAYHLSSSAAFYLRQGQPVMAHNLLEQGLIRLYAENSRFLGIGEMLDDGRVAPRRLLE